MTRLLNMPMQFNRYVSTTFVQISEYVWKFFLLIIGMLVMWLNGFGETFLREEDGPISCSLGLVNFELKNIWLVEKVGPYLSRTSFFCSNKKSNQLPESKKIFPLFLSNYFIFRM